MKARDLQDDLIEFLEVNARWSHIFYSCLEYSDIYMEAPKHSPPACSSAIAKLATSTLYGHTVHATPEESSQTCSVCLERLIDGFGITRMPCGHVYHVTCIVPWLLRTCVCPECRYEVQTTDVRYEIGRKQRMRDRPVVKCNCHGVHKCFFTSTSTSTLASQQQMNTTSKTRLVSKSIQYNTATKLTTGNNIVISGCTPMDPNIESARVA